MAGVMKLACMILACMIVTSPIATSALTCSTVTSTMAPCIGYLTTGAPLPATCCTSVTNLNGMARTTPDRQQACSCLKEAATSLGSGLNLGRAAELPKACGVDVPYAISPSTDCNNVK